MGHGTVAAHDERLGDAMTSQLHLRRVDVLKRHAGFTMIELVASMAGASLLLAGLAVAMLVTNRALEDAATLNSRAETIATIADRMADDARYATAIAQVSGAISMTIPDRDGDGLNESIVYAPSPEGMTRSHSLNPAVTFLSTAPTTAMRVDGYTSPTVVIPPPSVELLGWTQAATTGRTWALTTEMPSGTRSGDLLVLVTAGNEAYVAPLSGGWSAEEYYEGRDLYVAVFTRTATTTELTSQAVYTIGFTNSSIAAAVHCFSGSGLAGFDDGMLTSNGFARPTSGLEVPVPLQRAVVPKHAMNLQIFALEEGPLSSVSSGLAGFSDVAVTVATDSGSDKLTLVTAVRNGKLTSPIVSTLGLSRNARWVQIATQWWP